MSIRIPIEQGNQALSDGSLPGIIQGVLGELKPEAAYFFTIEGQRGGAMVFDLTDSSRIPSITEPLFQQLHAKVEFCPVMNLEDLTKGLSAIAPTG